jgi:hypothetical protein
MPSVPIDPRTRAAALLGAALMAVPLWVGRYLPLLDLPQHLALATVLLRHGDPAWVLGPYFEAQHGELTPYWTHYLALEGLGQVLSMDAASRVFATAYVLALPWAAMALLRALGRPPALGLLSIPLALNANFYYGFLAYCAGVVLMMWTLALVAREMDAPRTSRAPAIAVLAAALFFTHVQPFAFLLLGAAMLVPFGDAPWWKRVLRTWPLGPAVVGLFLPWLYLATTPQPGVERYFPPIGTPGARFQDLGDRVRGFPDAVAGSYQDGSDGILLGAVAVALIAGARARETVAIVPMRRAVALLLAALVCYGTLPVAIQGQWNIAQRFAWLAALLLPFALRQAPRWLPAATVALAAATAANAARQHVRFEREAAPFDRALAAIAPGSRVLGLTYDPKGRVLERWPYLHFEQYAVVRGGGMAAHSFAANAPLPVRLRTGARLPASEVWRPHHFRYHDHGRYFDYFLVRDPGGDADPLRALEAHVEEVFRGGAWRVYRRRSESSGR